ncbi:MAG TPA: DUF2974 domain-containing protein [Erysipelothrix sp.]|nr:DUF2974 domain-containing protein [Erysipelothrix sp.]
MNTIEYVKQEREHPIDCHNEVDALVLSQSVYFTFEHLVSQLELAPIYLSDLNIELVSNPTNNPIVENHLILLRAMKHSPHFRNLKVLDFESHFSVEEELQFAAITYLINEQNLFIVFRGTDFSTIGWKEDFNMTFSKDVPAQVLAVEYINRVMSLFDYPTYIGGHSKGGNLSVYGSSFCDKDYQLRIVKVYNFDGPGFRSNVIESEEYLTILHKVVKYIPRSSVVGLFLSSQEITKVVESTNFSILQHDAFSWKIEGNSFVYKEQPTNLSKHFSKTIKDWLEEIDDDKRKYLIDAVFSGLSALDITSFDDPSQFNFSTISNALSEYNNAEPEFKEFLREILWSFVKGMFDLRRIN